MLTILHTYSGACSVQCKANIYFLWWIKSGLFTAILLFSRSSIFYLYSVMNVTDGHLNGAGWLGEASGRWLGGIILIMSDKLSGASLRIISRHDHGPPAPGHELIRGASARMLSLLCPSRIYASFSSYFQLLLKYEEIHLSRAQMFLAVDRNLRPGCCGWAEQWLQWDKSLTLTDPGGEQWVSAQIVNMIAAHRPLLLLPALPGPGLNCPSYLQLKVSKLMVKYFETLNVVHGRSIAQSVL